MADKPNSSYDPIPLWLYGIMWTMSVIGLIIFFFMLYKIFTH